MKPQEKILKTPQRRGYGKQFRLAVTGSVCAGKSIVLNLLQREGCNGLDVSQLAAMLLQRDKALFLSLNDWLNTQPDLNRLLNQKRVPLARLLPQLYLHPELPEALYTFLTHTISKELKRFLFTPTAMGVLVVEDPLVLEKNETHFYDAVWVIEAPTEQQQQRLVQRDYVNPVDAESLLSLYCTCWQNIQPHAHKILINDGELSNFKEQVLHHYSQLATTLAFYRRYS